MTLLSVHVSGSNNPNVLSCFPQREGDVQQASLVGLAQSMKAQFQVTMFRVCQQ
jgi:hypothetical protein